MKISVAIVLIFSIAAFCLLAYQEAENDKLIDIERAKNGICVVKSGLSVRQEKCK